MEFVIGLLIGIVIGLAIAGGLVIAVGNGMSK